MTDAASATMPSEPVRAVRPLRICIISHNAYGALLDGSSGHIGGAERQTSQIARWFAAHGHDASLITWDQGQPDGEALHGVKVWKTCRADSGMPGLRFFYPRMAYLFRAMRNANADIYYHNSAEYVTGMAAWWCQRNGRKFAYSAAAELACDIRLPLLKKGYERSLYRHGVRNADLRIVQTQRQKELFAKGWGLDSVVLPMPVPSSDYPAGWEASFPSPPRVVWAGRVDENKRLGWLLEIAAKLPHINFEVAAAVNAEGAFAENVFRQARGLRNVRLLGSVPRDEMPNFYRGARCLCCTSMHEGFPNTFIEAWSHGVPVVTTFDPGGLITSLGLGQLASDINGLAAGIKAISAQERTWREYSQRARQYYLDNHQVDAAMQRFESELGRLVTSGKF